MSGQRRNKRGKITTSKVVQTVYNYAKRKFVTIEHHKHDKSADKEVLDLDTIKAIITNNVSKGDTAL